MLEIVLLNTGDYIFGVFFLCLFTYTNRIHFVGIVFINLRFQLKKSYFHLKYSELTSAN